MTTHIPLQVHAELAGGVAASSAWGIALDGLLAGILWQQHKADLADQGEPAPACRSAADPPDLPLPLARCNTGTDDWHWAATYSDPTGQPADLPPEQRLWTRNQDARALEATTGLLPKNLPERQGRYRSVAMPSLVINATRLTWQAVGDPDTIRQLLHQVHWVGKRRHTGEGRVLGWVITPRPDLDGFSAAHLHPDGRLGRPAPPGCLTGHEVPNSGTGLAALRPPNQHPSRHRVLVLPAGLGHV